MTPKNTIQRFICFFIVVFLFVFFQFDVKIAQAQTTPAAYDYGDYSSNTLTTKAWVALASNDLNGVLAYTNMCIQLYAAQAKQMQAGLSAYPVGTPNDIFSFWALNDVATSYYIQGIAYRNAKMLDQWVLAFTVLIQDYSFGQCWDPNKAHFWQPAVVAANDPQYKQYQKAYKALYNAALLAIKKYQNASTIAAQDVLLSSAVELVSALKNFNEIQVTANGPGIYDDALSQLAQATKVQINKNNNITTISRSSMGFSSTAGIYGSDFKVDEQGNVFIYTPPYSNADVGRISEYKTDGSIVQIPLNTSLYYFQGFSVRGNVLVTLHYSYPRIAQAEASIYLFNNNAWVKQSTLNIDALAVSSFSGLSPTDAANVSGLALSEKALVVTLSTGKFLVFNNYYAGTPNTPFYSAVDYSGELGAYTYNNVDADGNYIAMGSGFTGSAALVLEGKDTIGVGNKLQRTWSEAYRKAADYKSPVAFSASVVVYQAPAPNNFVTVAISSIDFSGQQQGTVYLLVKGINEKKFSELKPLPLLLPSQALQEGFPLVMKNRSLVIPYYVKSAKQYGYFGSSFMVYKLNNRNQWTWGYSLDSDVASNVTHFTYVAVGGKTLAYIFPFDKPNDPTLTLISS